MKVNDNKTQKRMVINHLASGKSITPSQALKRYGVKNLRATVSTIRNQVERYDNHMIVSDTNSMRETNYRMYDVHRTVAAPDLTYHRKYTNSM